jgi:hypothetical protein
METDEHYLMKLLDFPNLKELREFLNAPENPTGGMRPPDASYRDVSQLVDEEERVYQSQS